MSRYAKNFPVRPSDRTGAAVRIRNKYTDRGKRVTKSGPPVILFIYAYVAYSDTVHVHCMENRPLMRCEMSVRSGTEDKTATEKKFLPSERII